jgi:mycothiol synthase
MIPGHTARPLTLDDAESVLAVGIARDVADTGQPDWSLEAVRDELSHPNLDLERDGLVVADGGGTVVAFAVVNGIDARVVVHPDAEGRGIGAHLSGEAEQRARGRGAAVLRQEIMSANERGRDLLVTAGYELEQRYWRMVRDLDGSERAPDWPGGVSVRNFERGRDERAAYELVSTAMAEIPGNTERTFEEWTARALGNTLAPELSAVAEDAGGAMVGITLCERWEDGGYVDYIAVAAAERGRGLGRALLLSTLAAFAAAGMERGILWVNGRNESATRLYRSAGMDVSFSADRYVKPL